LAQRGCQTTLGRDDGLSTDQVPEALLPLVLFAGPLDLGVFDIVAVVGIFTLVDIVAKPLRHSRRRAGARS